ICAMYDIPYHEKDLSQYSFLVTGGAGFIGSNIVEYLLKYKAKKVRVLDNLATGRVQNTVIFEGNPAYQFINGDIRDLATCRKACEGIDLVSHQAALGSVPRSIKEPENTNAVNVDGFVNMLVAAKDAGVKSFVYASSSSVYGDEKSLPKVEEKIGNPLSPYAVSKYANELYAKVFNHVYGMRITGMRYFNIFGPRQDPNGQYAAVMPLFIDKIMKREPVYIDGDGEQTRDFTFVENAVQANIRAMLTDNIEAFGTVFNIAVGENFSVNRLYSDIQKLLGSDHAATYRESRKGDIRNSLADISKAKNLLGYNPEFPFSKGLALTVDYFRNLK
ncbi:MAG TPA: SDR family oxidoreductase, partial [Chitinophagales bacterium]|nr:SDR family oxidoreductase [Chitinophagales bacterium]